MNESYRVVPQSLIWGIRSILQPAYDGSIPCTFLTLAHANPPCESSLQEVLIATAPSAMPLIDHCESQGSVVEVITATCWNRVEQAGNLLPARGGNRLWGA